MFLLLKEEILDKYRLIQPVKCSEISEVWIAIDDCGKYAILKAIYWKNGKVQQILKLANLLKKKDCSGIVKISDYGISESGIAYIVMPYMEKGSLAELLSKNGKLSLGQTVCMLLCILNGLSYLHSLNIIHRDIKPANIWISKEGLAYLGDFGIAKVLGFPDEIGKVFGTAGYMSPEQAKDTSQAVAASDFFSLGCVAYECLTGCRKYSGKSFVDTLKAVISDKKIEAKKLEKFASMPLARLLCKMMNPSPQMRPNSAENIIKEIKSMELPYELLS